MCEIRNILDWINGKLDIAKEKIGESIILGIIVKEI